jgi:uncharacterized repeat protein (TIGR01451 family)
MATTTKHNSKVAQPTEHLPVWWRCVLIATATVILCACNGPVTRTHLAPDTSLLKPQLDPRVPPTLPEGVVAGLPSGGAVCSDQCDCGCDCGCHDPYGPVVGPGDEYLCDGGDFVTPAGVQEDWSIVGLEQEDAIGHYDTLDGRTIVTPSTRVCIYSPRFAAVRRVVQPIAYEQPVFINQTLEERSPVLADKALPPILQFQRHKVAIDVVEQPPNIFRQRQQAGGVENLLATMEAFNSVAVQANLAIIRTGEVSAAEQPLVERLSQAAIAWTGVQAPQVVFGVKQAHAEIGIKQPGVIYQTDGPDNPKLRLVKLASCGHAAPGEEVEFTLRYDNVGDQEIGNVTIVDNLSTRLEYVPESAKSSVDADFITQANDGGSLILRWEIRDPVKPGDGGVLRFRVKVR